MLAQKEEEGKLQKEKACVQWEKILLVTNGNNDSMVVRNINKPEDELCLTDREFGVELL